MTPNERQCKFCGKVGEIIFTRRWMEKESCLLECGHNCVYDPGEVGGGGRVGYGNVGHNRECPICGAKFVTYVDDAYGWFCLECRKEQSITSAAEAQALMPWIEQLNEEERKVLKESKSSRRSPYSGSTPPLALVPKRSPVDAAKVAATVRAMVQYGVQVHEMDQITQPTAYVLAKNGMFEVRRTDIASIISQPKEIMGLEHELKVGVQLNIPKVPYTFLGQTVSFFREVEKKSGAEALVQIWWNTQEKGHVIHCPEQTVSGGSVRHHSTFDQEQARTPEGDAIWLHVMDIHSHNTMGAFWSSVDDGDEMKAPEGRMFGVIGKIKQPIPDWKWRIRTREGFMELGMGDLWDVDLTVKVPFVVTWEAILGQLGKAGAVENGMLNLRCPVDPFKDVAFPEEWMARLSGRHHGGGGGGFGGVLGSNYGGRPSLPCFIYIRAADGRSMEECEVIDGRAKPTGKIVPLVGGEEEKEKGHVH